MYGMARLASSQRLAAGHELAQLSEPIAYRDQPLAAEGWTGKASGIGLQRFGALFDAARRRQISFLNLDHAMWRPSAQCDVARSFFGGCD
jgi:hypothetical protein